MFFMMRCYYCATLGYGRRCFYCCDDEYLDEGYRPRPDDSIYTALALPGVNPNLIIPTPPNDTYRTYGWVDPNLPITPPDPPDPPVDPLVPSNYVWPPYQTFLGGFAEEPVQGTFNTARRIRLPSSILMEGTNFRGLARQAITNGQTYFGAVGDCADIAQFTTSLRFEYFQPNFELLDANVNRFITLYISYVNQGLTVGGYNADLSVNLAGFSIVIPIAIQGSPDATITSRVDIPISSLLIPPLTVVQCILEFQRSQNPIPVGHRCFVESIVCPYRVGQQPYIFRGDDLQTSPLIIRAAPFIEPRPARIDGNEICNFSSFTFNSFSCLPLLPDNAGFRAIINTNSSEEFGLERVRFATAQGEVFPTGPFNNINYNGSTGFGRTLRSLRVDATGVTFQGNTGFTNFVLIGPQAQTS